MQSAESSIMFIWKTLCAFLLVLFACSCLAQSPASGGGAAKTASPLAGTWHNITQPQFPQGVLLIGEDGYYCYMVVSPNRGKPAHDFDHRTKEELAKQFGGLRASYGTWKIVDNKLIRTVIAGEEPGSEGKETSQEFRLEGDVLVLGGTQHPSGSGA
jgi:hypothetical protein